MQEDLETGSDSEPEIIDEYLNDNSIHNDHIKLSSPKIGKFLSTYCCVTCGSKDQLLDPVRRTEMFDIWFEKLKFCNIA